LLADLVAVFSDPHQEVVWLDILMDEVLQMNVLHPIDHLLNQHEDGLQGKPTGAEVEEILQGLTQQVHHQHVVTPFLSVPSAI
jgi:hypothetical protein